MATGLPFSGSSVRGTRPWRNVSSGSRQTNVIATPRPDWSAVVMFRAELA